MDGDLKCRRAGGCRYLTNHANIDYLMGVASCFLWLLGFLLLTHWHIYSINDTKSIGLLGTLFKLLAAVFFNMQSISALWDETASASLPAAASGGSDSGADAPNWFTSPLDYGNVAPGNAYRYQIGWSNFTGICLFHFGNMLSVYFMMSPSSELFKYNDKFHFSNAPVWGMWVYLLATTFLVTSNALGFFCSDPDVEGAVDDCDVKYGLFWGFTAFCQVMMRLPGCLGSLFLTWRCAFRSSGGGRDFAAAWQLHLPLVVDRDTSLQLCVHPVPGAPVKLARRHWSAANRL
jgi:hypothetical protein